MVQIWIVGSCWNRRREAVLTSTHNLCRRTREIMYASANPTFSHSSSSMGCSLHGPANAMTFGLPGFDTGLATLTGSWVLILYAGLPSRNYRCTKWTKTGLSMHHWNTGLVEYFGWVLNVALATPISGFPLWIALHIGSKQWYSGLCLNISRVIGQDCRNEQKIPFLRSGSLVELNLVFGAVRCTKRSSSQWSDWKTEQYFFKDWYSNAL